jgi:adenine-specific DNA-methyltransferase
VDKLKLHSLDLTRRNIDRLAELFPTVVTEQVVGEGDETRAERAVDFDLLRQELSDHVIEGPRERYQLDWPGKREALFTANAPIAKSLRPIREESVDFDTTQNLFIEGDNLEALKLLQESYLGQVKMIYIDPPYNTGKDFIYDDDFSATTEDFLRRSGQTTDDGARLVANPQANGRFHSDWLSMMYPRLKLARNLLADDGVVMISIDDIELPNLVKVCSETFGAANHLANLVWKSKSGGANDSGGVAVDHEYVVCFARNAAALPLGLDPDGEVTTSYPHRDERGRYSLERLDKQNLQYSPSLDYQLVGPDGSVYKLSHRDPSQPNAVWRWSRHRVEREMDQLVFRDGNVYTKNYEKSGAKPRSLLVDERFGRTRTGSTELRQLLGGDFFDNPKPTKLMETLLAIGTGPDSLVLDFFAGSATTAHAVMKLNARRGGNRRWILVQMPERTVEDSAAAQAGYADIAQLARERVRRAGEQVIEQAGLAAGNMDVGFRAVKVDTTNMSDVRFSPDAVDQAQLEFQAGSIKPDRSGEDLLFQVLLDWGLELTMPMAVEEVEGHEVLVVEEGALVACFDEAVSLDVVRWVAAREPLRAVFRDSAFQDDAARINAEQVFAEVSPATDVKVI